MNFWKSECKNSQSCVFEKYLQTARSVNAVSSPCMGKTDWRPRYHGCHEDPAEPSGLYLCSRYPSLVCALTQKSKNLRTTSVCPAAVSAIETKAPSLGQT